MPTISIVIPMFNRAHCVGRTIGSCVRQGYRDFEIIVVDDGSSDGSVAAAEAFSLPFVRILRHERNRGVGPARNTGVAAASGEWIVLLDSDDELMDGALDVIARRIAEAPRGIDALWFRCRLDAGTLTPDPPPEGIWDYRAVLAFKERRHGGAGEMMLCARRTALLAVPFPHGRMLEDLFGLDFARRFKAMPCRDVVRLYHQDAGNQLGAEIFRAPDLLRDAEFLNDRAEGAELVLKHHGAALRRHAPGLYVHHACRGAQLRFYLGQRGAGLRLCLAALAFRPARARIWAILAFGVIGPRWLVMARALWIGLRFGPLAAKDAAGVRAATPEAGPP